MATLKDVANETGLTVSTVSRILNNRGYISENSREKVYAAMKKLNYQPNEVARSLIKRRTNTIGVIVPHIIHPFFADLIHYLELAASKASYKILLCNSHQQPSREQEYINMCTSNRVSGIVICSAHVNDLKLADLDIPVVVIEKNRSEGIHCIHCDNYQGGALAAQQLIDSGCRHLLYFRDAADEAMPADKRAAAFFDIAEKNSVDAHEILFDSENYETLEYVDRIIEGLEAYPDTDGVFSSSDLIASQVLLSCHRTGRRVPEDVKVVGFDDCSLASITIPQITTIHQPVREMAEMAVQAIIKKNEGETVPTTAMLPVYLVKRESC